ncbi:MAG: type I-B CRISPR-associated endonuclease Cas1b [Victivallaceae bacterium]|nr:type I-B CRISPR-associated endonuclease Cas1b [Victivallaceae bacterium]
MNLYLTRSGRLRRRDNTLRFEAVAIPGEDMSGEAAAYEGYEEHDGLDDAVADAVNSLPIESIDAVYLFGEITMNSRLVNFLNSKHIPVHFFNWFGNHTGTILPHAEQLSGDLVIRQSEACRNMSERLTICRALLVAVFHNIGSILRYYQRRKGGLDETISAMERLKSGLAEQTTPEGLMGIEGSMRKLYYQSWPVWLTAANNFKRIYHPPDNPLNALISFLNSLLYTACVGELYRTALYPGISYLHTPQTRRYSLALDLVEPFKPLMVDRLLFRLYDCRMVGDRDFRKYSNGFLLTDDARRRILQEWDQGLRKTVHVASLNRSVSYRQLLRLDCYKLVNYLLEGREYRPYMIDY